MNRMEEEGYSVCLAKYYCSGGCPEFRNEKLNCERRVKKYARMFIQKASEK